MYTNLWKITFHFLRLPQNIQQMEPKVIVYWIYPGDSARMFPNLKSLIYVKPDLFEKWEKDPESVNFRDVLIDPSNPVTFVGDWTWATLTNVSPSYLVFWYQTSDLMEIAIKTAKHGRCETLSADQIEKMKKSVVWTNNLGL